MRARLDAEGRARAPHRRGLLAGAGALVALPALPALAMAADQAERVRMETGQGVILLDLFTARAPITSADFLAYVDAGLYDGAAIYRAERVPGTPGLGLVQGGARADPSRTRGPIAHESTVLTGLSHTDGTLSLARFAPGTATSEFFICVGAASYLDANPAAPGDNAGFAAFGRVAEGMDVVRKILALPTSPTLGAPGMVGQMLDPPVPIVRAARA